MFHIPLVGLEEEDDNDYNVDDERKRSRALFGDSESFDWEEWMKMCRKEKRRRVSVGADDDFSISPREHNNSSVYLDEIFNYSPSTLGNVEGEDIVDEKEEEMSTLYLMTKGWTLEAPGASPPERPSCLYNESNRSLLTAIDRGCLTREALDEIPECPTTLRVIDMRETGYATSWRADLRPTADTVAHFLKQRFGEDVEESDTTLEALRRVLLDMSDPLCVDPDPEVHRAASHLLFSNDNMSTAVPPIGTHPTITSQFSPSVSNCVPVDDEEEYLALGEPEKDIACERTDMWQTSSVAGTSSSLLAPETRRCNFPLFKYLSGRKWEYFEGRTLKSWIQREKEEKRARKSAKASKVPCLKSAVRTPRDFVPYLSKTMKPWMQDARTAEKSLVRQITFTGTSGSCNLDVLMSGRGRYECVVTEQNEKKKVTRVQRVSLSNQFEAEWFIKHFRHLYTRGNNAKITKDTASASAQQRQGGGTMVQSTGITQGQQQLSQVMRTTPVTNASPGRTVPLAVRQHAIAHTGVPQASYVGRPSGGGLVPNAARVVVASVSPAGQAYTFVGGVGKQQQNQQK